MLYWRQSLFVNNLNEILMLIAVLSKVAAIAWMESSLCIDMKVVM